MNESLTVPTTEIPAGENPGRADDLLRLALDVGEGMLRAGGEISRVENTVERIAVSYGAVHTEVFCLPSLILASVRLSNGDFASQMRRVHALSNNLLRLERFNEVSRRVCAERPSFEVFERMIREAKEFRGYPLLLRLFFAAVAAGAFTLFFGGGLRDAIPAALIGMLIQWIDGMNTPFLNQMAKLSLNSFVAGTLACLFVLCGIGVNTPAIILGTVMILIPGLAFGTAVRNLLYGDLLAGSLEILRAILSAFMIALGYCLSMLLAGSGILPPAGMHTPLVQLIGAAGGAVGFAGVFHSHHRHLLPAAVGGLFTHLIYLVAGQAGAIPFLSALYAALFFALFSEVMARLLRAPATVFLIPCAIPLVPGGSLYNAMVAFISKDTAAAFGFLSTAVQVGLGMACGIVAVSILFGFMKHIRQMRIKQ